MDNFFIYLMCGVFIAILLAAALPLLIILCLMYSIGMLIAIIV
jgi:hypothetical protein